MRWRSSFAPAAMAAAAVLAFAAAPSAVAAEPLEPVVEGLDGPRGLAVGPHGQVVFSEADGSVSRLATRGEQAGDVRELFSVPAGFLAPAIDARKQRVFALTTAGPPGTGAGTLYRWGPHRGVRPLADISGYQQRDPDPYDLEDHPEDSNPYGVAALPRGGALVADAAGNDLLRVSPRGNITTVARVKPMVVKVPRALPDEFDGQPLPPAGTPIPAEAVTTSVVVGADGYWYVGELRGFPATPGTSHVWRIKPGSTDAVCNPKRPHRGDCQLYAYGFTSIVDLGAAPDGSIYVAELVKRSWLQWEFGVAEPIGGIFRIPPSGGPAEELAAGQVRLPGGVEAGRNGKVYVTGPIFGPGSVSMLHTRG